MPRCLYHCLSCPLRETRCLCSTPLCYSTMFYPFVGIGVEILSRLYRTLLRKLLGSAHLPRSTSLRSQGFINNVLDRSNEYSNEYSKKISHSTKAIDILATYCERPKPKESPQTSKVSGYPLSSLALEYLKRHPTSEDTNTIRFIPELDDPAVDLPFQPGRSLLAGGPFLKGYLRRSCTISRANASEHSAS